MYRKGRMLPQALALPKLRATELLRLLVGQCHLHMVAEAEVAEDGLGATEWAHMDVEGEVSEHRHQVRAHRQAADHLRVHPQATARALPVETALRD
jgi:hypothetical protein